MRQLLPQRQNNKLLPGALGFLIAVPLALSSNSHAQAAPKADTVQAPAPVAGAPRLGFNPTTAATAPIKLAGQPSTAAPEPRLDPVTHAPLGVSMFRAAEGVSAGTVDKQESRPAADGSLQQGLKVHGHWVINVRNPDGTLVQHHEFENSLETTGQGFLVGLLSGFMVPGDWMIVLGAQSGNGPCTATYQFCGMVRSPATYPGLGYCNNYYCTGSTLSYAYNFGSGFAGPYSIVLTGSITANLTGTVGNVATLLSTCANIAYSSTTNPSSIETGSPSACVTQTAQQPWYGPLTSTNLTTPIAVTSGQQIETIVTITFS